MSDVIIPLTGAFVGGFVGGPTGAAIGWTLGRGLTTSAETQKITQQALSDLRIQSSEYGIPIPRVYGKQRVTGNIIWSREKERIENTQSVGKSGDVTTTTYRATFAVLFCEGPIVGISRCWFDGKLVVDNGSNLPFTLYLGTTIQTPDPTIESYEGSGNVPAYRGFAYGVVEQLDLGAQGRIPNISVEVLREL